MKLSRLSRLSRAQSVNLKHTVPGTANPYYLEKTSPIDRNHPAFNHGIGKLPSYTCPHFTIRALPNGVLQEPVNYVPINPLLATGVVRASRSRKGKAWWSKIDVDTEKTQPESANVTRALKPWDGDIAGNKRKKWLMAKNIADVRVAAFADAGRRSLGLGFRTAKKTTSKSCVIRRRLRSKITAAVRLVVCRGADTVNAPESDEPRPEGSHPPLKLVTNPLPEHDKLVLQGWMYIVIPDLSLYRMPMPNIVQHVRKAFHRMMQSAHRLEETWATQKATRTKDALKPPRHPSTPSPRPRAPGTLSKPLNHTQRPPIPSLPPDTPDTLPTSESETELVQTLTPLPLTRNPRRPRVPSQTPGETPAKLARPSTLPRMFARPPVILPQSKRTNADEQ